jgi:hypothetical protein
MKTEMVVHKLGKTIVKYLYIANYKSLLKILSLILVNFWAVGDQRKY